MTGSGDNGSAMPPIDCPACGERMRCLPWKTRPGGRYVCACGYRFWVTTVNDGGVLLPEFRGPKKRDEPSPDVPADLELRKNVMRQWKEARLYGPGRRREPEVLGPTLALAASAARESAAPYGRVCL